MSLCVPVTDYGIGVGGGQNTDFRRKDDVSSDLQDWFSWVWLEIKNWSNLLQRLRIPRKDQEHS